MAHNFRLTGNFYVSKAGNDANDGLSKDTPKATINAALGLITATSQTIIIGTGVYEELISRPGNNTIIRADGNVKIRGNGSNSFALTATTGHQFYDIIFENYASINFNVSAAVRCWFMNIPSFTGSWGGVTNCIFINATHAFAGVMNVTYSIFINSSVNVNTSQNCYYNANSTRRNRNNTSYINNNVMGSVINSAGTVYASLAAYMADPVNAAYDAGSFNLPPKFNNVYKYDFTLQYDSPHIGTASDGLSNIGGTSYAKVSDMYTDPEWQIANGATYSKNNGTGIAANMAEADIVYDGQDLVLASGKTKGYVIPAAAKVSANPQALTSINLNGIAYFNKSANNGTLMNDNVPDADAYPSTVVAPATPPSVAGVNPDRLSYGFRYTDNDTMPGSDIDWINGYNGPAGAFILLEPFSRPLVNSNGIGTGSASFDTASGIELSVIWVQPKITLTRLYA